MRCNGYTFSVLRSPTKILVIVDWYLIATQRCRSGHASSRSRGLTFAQYAKVSIIHYQYVLHAYVIDDRKNFQF